MPLLLEGKKPLAFGFLQVKVVIDFNIIYKSINVVPGTYVSPLSCTENK
jgi:hypothetical protein